MKVFVFSGPNLGRLGKRKPEIYGHTTHAELAENLVRVGSELGLDVEVRQTDHEGEMVAWLHEAANEGIPVVLNPGGWAHYSIAVADAAAQVELVVEVHISNLYAREEFRQKLVITPYVRGKIAGLGLTGYELGLHYIAKEIATSQTG